MAHTVHHYACLVERIQNIDMLQPSRTLTQARPTTLADVHTWLDNASRTYLHGPQTMQGDRCRLTAPGDDDTTIVVSVFPVYLPS